MKLKDLEYGERFVLCRTGEKYKLIKKFDGHRLTVERDGLGNSTLNRQCEVKPIKTIYNP